MTIHIPSFIGHIAAPDHRLPELLRYAAKKLINPLYSVVSDAWVWTFVWYTKVLYNVYEICKYKSTWLKNNTIQNAKLKPKNHMMY